MVCKLSQTFEKFFQLNVPKKIFITSHENADPDALCSAFAIKYLIESRFPDTDSIIDFDGLNNVSHKIVTEFSLNIEKPPNYKTDGIIIVDTNSIEQIGALKNELPWDVPILVIDHHEHHPNTSKFANSMIIDEETVSTAELIFDIYEGFNILPSDKVAALLFLGLLSDSRHLTLANNKTLHIVNKLLELGVNYADMIDILSIPMERPERIARLKAAQRAIIHEFDNWIVAVSHVSAYEASACRALIRLGADVALVYGQKQDEIRFSARATNEIAKKTDLNLARDIMEKIGPIMHGEGGGHDRAAGCEGKDNLERALKKALEILKEKLVNTASLLTNE